MLLISVSLAAYTLNISVKDSIVKRDSHQTITSKARLFRLLLTEQ